MKKWVGLMLASFWVFCIPCGESVAANLGVQGSVYEIGEQNALMWIRERLTMMEINGEIEAQNQKLKQQALATIERPTPMHLKPTQHERIFEKDLTLTVPKDIKDASQKILYLAGTRINPLINMFSHKSLIFFDGDDLQQLNWALQEYKKGFVKLVLIKGAPVALMRQYDIPFYFDQGGKLSQYFELEQVPAIVRQKKDKLIISEIKL
jgi:conjugal transfer pilus assembly protein TraW